MDGEYKWSTASWTVMVTVEVAHLIPLSGACVCAHLCPCTCVHACVCVVDQMYFPSCLLCICTHCVVHGPASQGRFSCLFQWHVSRGNQVAWVPAPGTSHPSWKVLGIKTREWSFPDLCNSYFLRWMTLWMWLWSGSAYAVLHIISYLFFFYFLLKAII